MKSDEIWGCCLMRRDGGVEWEDGRLSNQTDLGLDCSSANYMLLTLSKLQNLFVLLLTYGPNGDNGQLAGLLTLLEITYQKPPAYSGCYTRGSSYH